MEHTLDSLRRLLERLKTITLWDRLFHWGAIKSLLVDANGDLQRIAPSFESLRAAAQKSESQLELSQQKLTAEKDDLQKQLARQQEENKQFLNRGLELKKYNEILTAQVQDLQAKVSRFEADDDVRRKEHEKSVANFNKLTEGQIKRETDDRNEKQRLALEKLEQQKETWSNHQDFVRSRIKVICQRNAIDYVEKVPFRGNPDNALRIKEEFIVFDAKSPSNDDLNYFPTYLKNQVEQAIKYVREENVRKEVFLVVPTNTLDILDQFEYKLADYTVYIISLDALEPIILALKKIEEYEFADQLSPEERENICRVIGKFVHLSKRRIQIDGFFAKQFFELVYRSEADLPKDFLDRVVEFEKSEKLNPPIEKRSKQISTKELENETERLNSEANQRGILTQDSTLSRELNKMPLYSVEEDQKKDKDQGTLFP